MKAVIFGCEGESLSDGEKSLFERLNPLGFILFARNCQNPFQLKKLTNELRASVGREDVPILIDQEGGRICRLNSDFWRTPPSPAEFGILYETDPDLAYQVTYDNARLMAHDLISSGINVDCFPLADLPTLDAHPVIGNRAFSTHLDATVNLCLAAIEGLQDRGVTPVLKHFPGHGRAKVDSHEALPLVDASLVELHVHDFECFKQITESLHQLLRPLPWGMTAHIVYTALDQHNPATFSTSVIDYVIRGMMDFDGFLVSDDIGMSALSGSMVERAQRALNAGCDTILHCNGDFDEMLDVALAVPELSDESLIRFHESIPSHANFTSSLEGFSTNALERSIKEALNQQHQPLPRMQGV